MTKIAIGRILLCQVVNGKLIHPIPTAICNNIKTKSNNPNQALSGCFQIIGFGSMGIIKFFFPILCKSFLEI